MIEGNISPQHYQAFLGSGGEAKLDKTMSEIDKNIEESQKEIDAEKNKKVTDLGPLEQLFLLLDTETERARRYHEENKYELTRDKQFQNYVSKVYGVQY